MKDNPLTVEPPAPAEPPALPEAPLHFALFAERKACPVLVYAEQSLLKYPWSALDETEAGRPDIVMVRFPERRDGRSFLRTWEIRPGPEGLPGPFDRAVFRACEWTALETRVGARRSVPSVLTVSVREILERLRLAERPHLPARIHQALRRLAGLEIVEREGGGAPSRRRRLFAQLTLSTAEGRPFLARHAVGFDRFYTLSANMGGIRPLNWELWVSLERPLAQRLVEILDAEFERREPRVPAACGLSELRQRAPLPDTSAAQSRRALDEAHAELLDRRYLARVEWKGRLPGARVEYTPGATYEAFRERLRPLRRPSPLAHEIALALGDPANAHRYQTLVDLFDQEHLQGALGELRDLSRRGVTIERPSVLFFDILRREVRDAHLEWPLPEPAALPAGSNGDGRDPSARART
ncbi:MAG TPA: hypothetical protein VNO22_07870 [Planctomycetota bacterium]|nr:hypothetical protein [Planctomycetota bacterium]